MKKLHRPDLYGWSEFNTDRNIDFHSVLWVRDEGNVAIDPLSLTAHDESHLNGLGGLALIVLTNSDHVRAAAELRGGDGCEGLGSGRRVRGFPAGV